MVDSLQQLQPIFLRLKHFYDAALAESSHHSGTFIGPPRAHCTVSAALNILLVFFGGRPACLPAWHCCDIKFLADLMKQLNSQILTVDPVTNVKFQHRYPSGETFDNYIITRSKNPRINRRKQGPWSDKTIGLALGMHPKNVVEFSKADDGSKLSAFIVVEYGSGIEVYAERFSNSPSSEEMAEFHSQCEEKVASWNRIMGSFGLPYRFFSTFEFPIKGTVD